MVASIFEIPTPLTYLKYVGFTIMLLIIRFIINFFVKGIDIQDILKQSSKNNKPDKKYKFKITYKNKTKQEGEMMACSIEQVSDMLLNSQCNITNNGKYANYRNYNEMQFCEIEEINN